MSGKKTETGSKESGGSIKRLTLQREKVRHLHVRTGVQTGDYQGSYNIRSEGPTSKGPPTLSSIGFSTDSGTIVIIIGGGG